MSVSRALRDLVIFCLIPAAAMGAEPRIAALGNIPLSFVRQGDSFRARGQGYFIGLEDGAANGPNGETGPIDGAAAPLNLIYSTNATVTATVGTTDVPALFSGVTPGLAALYQVNIQMPPLGDIYGTVTVSLTLTAKDSQPGVTARSNSVQIYLGN